MPVPYIMYTYRAIQKYENRVTIFSTTLRYDISWKTCNALGVFAPTAVQLLVSDLDRCLLCPLLSPDIWYLRNALAGRQLVYMVLLQIPLASYADGLTQKITKGARRRWLVCRECEKRRSGCEIFIPARFSMISPHYADAIIVWNDRRQKVKLSLSRMLQIYKARTANAPSDKVQRFLRNAKILHNYSVLWKRGRA